MIGPNKISVFLVLFASALMGCSSSGDHEDLKQFVDEMKRRPPGNIKAPPQIEPYETFTYDAYRLRSPFDRPVSAEVQQQVVSSSSNVKPDLSRQKERLEQYDLATLSMVGTLKKDGNLWALISDPDGSIERIKPGNYIGRNHGKVTSLSGGKIELIEIVASGDGWLERPNIVELRTADAEKEN
ncbi:MAG: pilus assembly protein PilP [Cellvibrionaceae bacterium]